MKLLSIYLLFIIIAFGNLNAVAQNPELKRTHNWYFGFGAGLDFSSGTAIAALGGDMYSNEGIATISDTSGNLLFYTDGDTIWDVTHNSMPSGAGLLGGCTDNSMTQSALIVPQPGRDSIYYMFSVGCFIPDSPLRYSIVDMSMNGGLGDVVLANQLLLDNATEKLTATHHANGCDIWIMTQRIDNDFYLYLLTDLGLITTPTIQNSSYTGSQFNDSYLKFSPDGSKIANPYHWSFPPDTLILYDFDNSIGTITNPIGLTLWNNSTEESYGIAFSPDNTKLYGTTHGATSGTSYLYQFDISSGVQAIIQASKTIIDSLLGFQSFWAAQIGADGKIYVVRETTNLDSLSVIHNPNALGAACNFERNGVYLGGPQTSIGLPNRSDS